MRAEHKQIVEFEARHNSIRLRVDLVLTWRNLRRWVILVGGFLLGLVCTLSQENALRLASLLRILDEFLKH